MTAVKLSPEERLRMNAQAAKGLVQILIAQLAMLMAVTVLTGLVSGKWSMLSVFAGGMAYFVPTAIAAAQMLMRLYANADASVGGLFVAEGIKIAGTIAILVLLAKFAAGYIVWPALLLGLISVMKAYLLLLMFRKI